MDAFFRHGYHAWSPSLASNSTMHQTNKSVFMECLESLIQEDVPNVDVKIVDGAALVHIIDPKKSQVTVKTFQDYSQLVFFPYMGRMLQDVVRTDVVWYVYREDSLNAQTRQNRGAGNQLRVDNNNWEIFLCVDTNKDTLFRLLANPIQEFQPPHGKQIIFTDGKNAVLSPMSDLSGLHCTREKADRRLLFHVSHAFHRGFSKIIIHATDIDATVLTIAVSSILQDCEIWVAFGHGSRLRYIPCHLFAAELGSDASWSILLTHAISGCDTHSSFYGIRKRTA